MITPLLCLLLAAAKATADAQAHGSPRLARWFPRWAGPDSWRLKYRNSDPAQGPAFPGSTTVLVAFTDLWHFANLVAGLATDAALLLLGWGTAWQWWVVAGVVVRRVAFQPIYSFLRK